ncbi:dienelactone hydrolase family protein [Neomegalonema sp.]|uniref:alpha/beta hydrolase n=1 Tax=Neomegalonema sp. TaxID=2039713 RepID=UPI00261284E7|nr:dienelactone hydrolase family protein [Neomegalonema sp.]MDD2868153.1 dienelactone hydrolase family protein [Neomegalonema sp.]
MSRLDGPRAGAAPGRAKSLVIFVHGYGANGEDLIGLSRPLGAILPEAAFVAPDAPQRCRASPFGFQWFPIPWMDGSSQAAMEQGFLAAGAALDGFLDAERELYGLPDARVALVGFSQGTMMSLEVGLRRTNPLAAIVGFSGRIVNPEMLVPQIRSRPPVLLAHGEEDPVVPFAAMGEARAALEAAGVEVMTLARPGLGHGIDPEGLTAAAQLLEARLAFSAPQGR